MTTNELQVSLNNRGIDKDNLISELATAISKLSNGKITIEQLFKVVTNSNMTVDDAVSKYLTGDIKMVLQEHVNYTYLTSSPTNIKKCLEINTPIAITIFDDYMYLADIVASDTAEKLRKTDKFVSFSGLVSAGLI